MIKTHRLNLRLLTIDDADLLFPLHADPEVMKYIRAADKTIEETKKTIQDILHYQAKHKGHGIYLAFTHRQEFIGWGLIIHIEKNAHEPIEVGYRLHQKEWHKGYATEIAQALIKYAHEELKIPTITGVTHKENDNSGKVLKKCGLKLMGTRNYYGLEVNFYSE